MTRAMVVAAIAAALVAGGCKGGKGGGTPFMDRALETQHTTIGDVEFDIHMPKGVIAEIQPQEAHWIAAADDTLDVLVQVASPTAVQNAINFEQAAGRRVTNTTETDDGWTITSGDAKGGFLLHKRMLKKGDTAIFCTATVSWKRPGHAPKRTAFVESLCNSLAPTKL
jgi:hypothetical protein